MIPHLTLIVLQVFFPLALALPPAPNPQIAIERWQAAAGDRLYVDLINNEGYLMASNGTYATFPVLSGQKRFVRYIGRSYFAATPARDWVVQSMDIKGRSMTFGETGTFLRLWHVGEQTPYGIHSHLTFQKMLDEGDRYRSMGCILVSEDVLKILVQSYEVSGKSFNVTTGTDTQSVVAFKL